VTKKKYSNQIEFTIFLVSAFIGQLCKFFFLVMQCTQPIL